MKLKQLIATLLLINTVIGAVFPGFAYAQDASSSALAEYENEATTSANLEPATLITEPLTINRTHPQAESSALPASELLIPSFSNDSPAQISALVKQPLAFRMLPKRDYKAGEAITFQIENTAKSELLLNLLDINGEIVDADILLTDTADGVAGKINSLSEIRPGKYTIEARQNDGQIAEAYFNLAVLTFNTNKSVYVPGDNAELFLAVSDHQGNIVCDAKLKVSITDPIGQIKELSTADNTISKNASCNEHNKSDSADYTAFFTILLPGQYSITISAETEQDRYTISETITVRDEIPFLIERQMPTRIYPPEPFPVTLKVTANEDFSGVIRDILPGEFVVTPSTSSAALAEVLDVKRGPVLDNIGTLSLPFKGDRALSLDFSGIIQDPLLKNLYSNFGLIGHDGLDFAMPIGTEVSAADQGTVIFSGPGDYGTTVILQHPWGRSYYGHLSSIKILVGQTVSKGQLIALSGNTGISTGPHLHFGIKPNDPDMQNGYYGKIDPLPYLGMMDNSQVLSAKTEEDAQKVKIISWPVNMKKDETIILNYMLKAPERAPLLSLIGPLQIVKPVNENIEVMAFGEARMWQTVSDQVRILGAQITTDGIQKFQMELIDERLLAVPSDYPVLKIQPNKELAGEMSILRIENDKVETEFKVKDSNKRLHRIKLTLLQAETKSNNLENNMLNMHDIFPNVDLHYAAYDGYLQQIIELKNYQTRREFVFDINKNEELEFLDLNISSGHIIGVNKVNGEELLTLRFPQGIDAKGQRIDYKYRIENNQLILYPMKSWQLEQAIFPIKIYAPINAINWNEAVVNIGDRCLDNEPCLKDGDVIDIKPAGWHWGITESSENLIVKLDKLNHDVRNSYIATTLDIGDYTDPESKIEFDKLPKKDKGRLDEYGQLFRYGIDYTQLIDANELKVIRKKHKSFFKPKIDARKKKIKLQPKPKSLSSIIPTEHRLVYVQPKRTNWITHILKSIIKPASAATIITKTIGSAAGRDYSTPQLWETNQSGNLVSNDTIQKGVMYADSTYTAGGAGDYVTIDGSTTDADHYMWLTVAISDRHNGTAGTGALIDCNNVTNGGSAVLIQDNYTKTEWIEGIKCTGGTLAQFEVRETTDVIIQNVLAHNFADASNNVSGIRAMTNSTANASMTVRNVIVYDGDFAGIVTGGSGTGNRDAIVQNVTVYGNTNGIAQRETGTFTVTNAISMGNSSSDFRSLAGTFTANYNLSSDATADDWGGTGNLINITASNQFVSLTAGSEDFHLKSGADAINAGTELSTSFTSDIDEGIRESLWDIGADEYITNLNDRLMRHGKYFDGSGKKQPFTF